MKKTAKRMLKQVVGEPNRFMVESDQVAKQPYFVDLEEYGANGKCDCKDFQVHEKEAREMAASGAYFFRCKHIESATVYKAMVAVIRDSTETQT